MPTTRLDSVVHVGTINDFANETTLHGLPRVLKPSNLYKRSVWFLLFSCSMIALIWQASELVNQFLSFKTVLSKNVEQSAIAFPPVTICNENGASVATRENIARHVSGYNTMDAFAASNYNLFTNLTINTFHRDNCSSNVCKFRQVYLTWFSNVVKMLSTAFRKNHKLDGYMLTANLGLNVSTLAGIRLQDIVYVCKFDGERCKMSEFIAHHHPHYLLCHTYKTKKSARVGQNRGLSLVLKYDPVSSLLKRLNVLYGLSTGDTSPGFRVVVHPPDQSPPLDGSGVVFYPGVKASLPFTKATYSRLGRPYSNCTNRITLRNSNVEYSAIGCADEYQQEVVRDLCNCTDISLPHEQSAVTRFPYCREITFPVECSFNASFWNKINGFNRRTMASIPPVCPEKMRAFFERLDCMVNASNIAYKRTTYDNLDLGCYPPCNQLKYEARDASSL